MTRGPLKAALALAAALAAATTVLVGCSAAASGPKAELLEVGVPLAEPSWAPDEGALLAVGGDGRRVVRVGVGEAGGVAVKTRKIPDLGENVVVDPEAPGRAYLGRPGRGEISVLNTDTLRVVGGYGVGGSPYSVTLDGQSEVVFALSEDGARVSSAELGGGEEIPAVRVEGGEGALIEAPEKGLEPAFWVADPTEVSYYHGDPPERLVGKGIGAADIAVDPTSAQRVYLADGERVVALEGDPQRYLEGSLISLAERDLGGTVERLACDELHVFAATRDELVAMRREGLEVVETVDFGRLLEDKGVDPGGISGIAVGSEKVYVAFEGAPYILSVKKP